MKTKVAKVSTLHSPVQKLSTLSTKDSRTNTDSIGVYKSLRGCFADIQSQPLNISIAFSNVISSLFRMQSQLSEMCDAYQLVRPHDI